MSPTPSRGLLCVWALAAAAAAWADEPAASPTGGPTTVPEAHGNPQPLADCPHCRKAGLVPAPAADRGGSPRADGRAMLDVDVKQVQVPARPETPRPRLPADSMSGPSVRPRIAPAPRSDPAEPPAAASDRDVPGAILAPRRLDLPAPNPAPLPPAAAQPAADAPASPPAVPSIPELPAAEPPPLQPPADEPPAAPPAPPEMTTPMPAPEARPAESSPPARSPGPIITYLPSAPAPPTREPAESPPALRPVEEVASSAATGPKARLIPQASPAPPAPGGPYSPSVNPSPDPAAPSMGIAPGYEPANPMVAPAADARHDHPGLRGFTYLPVMLGDQSPASLRPMFLTGMPTQARATVPGQPPTPPSPFAVRSGTNALIPWARGFKIADNQSPMPQDRVFYSYSYFDNMNDAVNRRLGSGITDMQAYRQLLGFEKTFWRGNASLGLRLPIDTLWSDSRDPSLRNNSTSVGNLTLFSKFLLYDNPLTGSLLSGGLAVTAPTGPSSFAGSPTSAGFRDVQIQPFLGYVVRRGRVYLQGFTAIDVPTDSRDVTMWYNDAAIGYFLYQNDNRAALLSAVVPTFEVHLNDPLSHRGAFRPGDPAGTPDVLDLTFGSSFILRQRLVATIGCSFPVTGPRPFDFEALALLNFYFGRFGMATPWPMPPAGR